VPALYIFQYKNYLKEIIKLNSMVNYGIEIAKRALKISAIKINPEHPFE
jgi:poly(3-hydroxyalkanoate) synthetase